MSDTVMRPPLSQLMKFTLTRIWYPLLLLPVLLLYGLVFSIQHGVHPGTKALAEDAALAVLGASTVISLLRWLQARSAFLLWLAAFSGALVLRELHADGTSTTPIYLLILALLLLLYMRYRSFAEYLAPRLNLSLLAGVLTTYFISVGCDKNLWTFVTGDIRLLQHVEEFIELAGHAQLMALALLARRMPNPLMQAA